MDAKEAIGILEVLTTTTESKTKIEAFSLAIEALEKVSVFEAENAREAINSYKLEARLIEEQIAREWGQAK